VHRRDELVALDDQQLTFADGGRVVRNAVAASLWVLESYPEVRHVGRRGMRIAPARCATCSTAAAGNLPIAQWICTRARSGHEAVWADRATAPAFAQVARRSPGGRCWRRLQRHGAGAARQRARAVLLPAFAPLSQGFRPAHRVSRFLWRAAVLAAHS
jgi:hypothetical protein